MAERKHTPRALDDIVVVSEMTIVTFIGCHPRTAKWPTQSPSVTSFGEYAHNRLFALYLHKRIDYAAYAHIALNFSPNLFVMLSNTS